jgi:allantoinase
MSHLIVRSERVVFPDGIRPASIQIRDGVIAAIEGYGDAPAGVERVDAGESVVLPGLVDTHVHLNDPGRAEWEGFESGTRAAAAGGVTTIVDMPLNSVPPTTTVDGLEAKLRAADGRCHVDVGFWGGVVAGNADDLEPLARAGVLGFKCFLSPSGVDEFEHVTEQDLRMALPRLAKLGLPLLAHAEMPSLLRGFDDAATAVPLCRVYRTWLESRPPESERAAIDLLITLGRLYGAHIHIVHLASADAVATIAAARAAGARITVETCPHYLTFAAEDIADGATAFKCAPPVRERKHREGLWRALMDGAIDFVATDHSPAPPALKREEDGDFVRAWGGIASLQIGLAAVWTGAVERGVPLDRLGRWLAAAPARLAGLGRAKGQLAVGRDADLVIWDSDGETVVNPAALYHRHPTTPYAGMRLRGVVRTTILRGRVIFRDDECVGPPSGRLLRRA